MRILWILPFLFVAGCGLGVDRAASELANSHAQIMAARGGWTFWELLGPDKSAKGIHTYYVNAVSTSEEGDETHYYWRYDLSDMCGTIAMNCSNNIEMTKLDAPGAFDPK